MAALLWMIPESNPGTFGQTWTSTLGTSGTARERAGLLFLLLGQLCTVNM